MYGGKHPSIFNDEDEDGVWSLGFRPLNEYVELSTQNEAGIGLFRCPSEREISDHQGTPGGSNGYSTYEYFGNCYLLNWRLTVAWNDDYTETISNENFRLSDVKIPFHTLVLAGDCQWYNTMYDTPWDANFHNYDDRMNLLFLDGHVEFIRVARRMYISSGYSFLPYTDVPEKEEEEEEEEEEE